RPIRTTEGSCLVPDALVEDAPAPPLEPDICSEVRELVEPPPRLDGEPTRGIEAEEPDPGLGPVGDVRSDVQLAERRHERKGEGPAGTEPRDLERCDPEPGAAVVLLDLERVGKVTAQGRSIHAPVGEEQLVPGLRHHPGIARQRPRPMVGLLERGGLPERRPNEVESYDHEPMIGRCRSFPTSAS